jgi:hypothetical protein
MVLNEKIAATPGIGEKQVVTERAHNPEVAGLNPAPATASFSTAYIKIHSQTVHNPFISTPYKRHL